MDERMKAWRKIWSKERKLADGGGVLSKLRSVVSDKKQMGSLSEEKIREFYDTLYARLGVKEGDSIFDLGCGSGSFLYYLREKGHFVAGMDYSPSLVEIASTYLPGMDIREGEAIECSSRPQFDYTVAMGLTTYFPDLEYAEKCLRIMMEKAIKAAAMISVLDAALKKEYEELRFGGGGGMRHFAIDKEWFVEMAIKYDLAVDIFSLSRGVLEFDEFYYHILLKKKMGSK